MRVNIRLKNGEFLLGVTIALDDIEEVVRYANRNPFFLIYGGEGKRSLVQSFSQVDFIEEE